MAGKAPLNGSGVDADATLMPHHDFEKGAIMTLVHRVTLTEEDFNGSRAKATDPPAQVSTAVPPAGGTSMPEAVPVTITHPGTVKYSAPWRQVVERKRLSLAMDLEQVGDATARTQISALLDVAHEAAEARVGIKKWWWGTEVERAWASLREAEEQVFEHGRTSGVATIDTDVLSQAKSLLPADDPRLVVLVKANDASGAAATSTADDVQVRRRLQLAALRAAHAESDRRHQEARFFRNRLVLATSISLMCIAALLVVQRALPNVSFITRPDGWSGSTWALLGLVMIFGSVGSLITAIPAMSAIPSDFSPFNLPLQQALLKFVLGALTAVVGLLIVGSSLVTVDLGDTFTGMLVLAVVFGAGQQAVTHFIDARAATILDPPNA